MAVTYRMIDSELVSVEWLTFLTRAREAGVRFRLNEGHRTMARQLWFWNCMRSRKCNNGNLAARPSPFAPHIRTGRIDHAIDVETVEGGNGMARLREYGRKHGVDIRLTVSGEPWHGEAPAADLRAFHAKHGTTQRDRWIGSRERRRGSLRKWYAKPVGQRDAGAIRGLKRTIRKLTQLLRRKP